MFLIVLVSYGLLSFGTFFAAEFQQEQSKKMYVTLQREEPNRNVQYQARLAYIGQSTPNSVVLFDEYNYYIEVAEEVFQQIRSSRAGYKEITGEPEDTKVCVLSDYASLGNIAKMFAMSDLVDNTKNSISRLLKKASEFQEHLLSRPLQIALTQKTFPLLQAMVVDINNQDQNFANKDLVADFKKDYVKKFSKKFKKAFSEIWDEE